MLVVELTGSLEIQLLRESVHNHREDEPNERAQANLVAGWHNQIKRNWAFVVHQVVDCEVTRRCASGNERIAVESQSCLRGREYAGKVFIFFIQHLLGFFFH